MLEYVDASIVGGQLWSADDIRERFPDGAAHLTEAHIGVQFGGHGALLVGTEQQVIDRLEAAAALIRSEHARIYGTPAAGTGCRTVVAEQIEVKPLTFAERLTDEQADALRDRFEPEYAAGDSDRPGGATYAYAVEVDVDADGVLIPAGWYLREVTGGKVGAWRVLAGNVHAYMEALAQRDDD